MIKVSKYSDIGGRAENEDCYAVIKNHRYVCAIVADGLGGHGGGAIASKKAVDVISNKVFEGEEFETEMFYAWFQETNEEILKLQTPECRMKTTIVILCLNKKKAFWAHAGDSRLYHFLDGRLSEITFDHSVSQMAVLSGEIEQKDIRNHVDRNKLLRAIGKADEIKVEVSEIRDITCGEHAFLLCTDGFWEYVLEEEMEQTLKESTTPKVWLNAMREKLQQRVDGKNDNNTAVAVFVTHGNG